ncbi:MAG: RNA methyltransferase, partial [Phaeodactylibacter sp.]|nr:RNA methyltransferase [Phaeodactylibacter sp.]
MTLSKNKEKFIKSLRLKKFRQKYNNFIVEGDKMARELLGQKPELVIAVFALEEWLSRVEEAADVAPEKLFPVSGAALRRISGLDTPNQVLVVSSIPNTGIAAGQVENSLSLYLDGIQDPGNFGTILRIADW